MPFTFADEPLFVKSTHGEFREIPATEAMHLTCSTMDCDGVAHWKRTVRWTIGSQKGVGFYPCCDACKMRIEEGRTP